MCSLLLASAGWAFAQDGDKGKVNPPRAGVVSSQGGPLTLNGKFQFYVRRTYHPLALLGPAASAGIYQWRDYPEEWGQGAEGYGRRLASRYGQKVIKNSIQFGVGALLKEDPRYFRSERRSFLPRVGHAIACTFVSRRDSGGKTFAFARFAGALGSGFISNA